MDPVVVGGATPELGFEVKKSGIEVGARIGVALGQRGIEDLDFALGLGEKKGGLSTYQLGNAFAG
jgi:hypothetical protein